MHWIFKSNPNIYDLEKALRREKEICWTIMRRYEKQVGVGDEVFLWNSGQDGGIYAMGRVTSPVTVRPCPDPYWRDPRKGNEPAARVTVAIDHVLSDPIRREVLKNDTAFKDSEIIKVRVPSMYRVTSAQLALLERLLR